MSLAQKMSLQEDDNSTLIEEFKVCLIEFCSLAERWGFILKPYSDKTWSKYGSLSSQVQKSIFQDFKTYSELCNSAATEGIPLNNDRLLVWHALKALKYRPPADLLNQIESGDVVEIYNAEQIQVFRNLRFFDISGYSLGDIFVHTWQELYLRSEECLEQTLAEAQLIFNGSTKGTKRIDHMNPQRLEELFSEDQLILDLRFKMTSPLTNRSGDIAMLVTSQVRVCGQKKCRPLLSREIKVPSLHLL